MIKNTPFGCKYDKKTNQLTINKKEAEIVKKVFSLSAYGFDHSEVARILNGESLYKIISEKILKIIYMAQEYNKKIGREFVYEDKSKFDLENILKNKVEINESIIKNLNKSKEQIKEIDSSMKDVLLMDIELIIDILNKLDEIEKITKY